MKKRTVIRIISFISALCVVFAASGMLLQKSKATYENALGKVRLSGLTSLCEYVHDISTSLRLLAVSGDGNVSESAALVYAKILGAQGSVSCFENVKTENISAFLSGVGSFSQGFSEDVISEEQRKNALMFSDYAQEMYYHLSDIANAVINGEYSLFEAGEIYSRRGAEFFENNLDFSNGTEKELFAKFASAPVQSKTVRTDKQSVTVHTAKENAAEFIGIQPQLLREKGEEELDGLQTYRFSHDGVSINICRYGGEVCRFIDSHLCSRAQCSFEEAENAAREMMEKTGCDEYELVFYGKSDFSVNFIFAPVINGILLLTGTVRIEVCLGECRIISFDAEDFHKSYPAQLLTLTENADVSALLPDNLTFLSSRICHAEIDAKERYCYFVKCLLRSEKVYIFIDYYTLKTVKTVFA